MSKKNDKDWAPTGAVRYWARKYAEKKYQRKGRGGRLQKLTNKTETENQSEVEELAQAHSLSVSIENLNSNSAPISRTTSLEGLIINKEV